MKVWHRGWSYGLVALLLVFAIAGCAAPTSPAGTGAAAPSATTGTTASVTGAGAATGATAPAVSAGANNERLSFSIATGGTGGVWYPLGGALGSVIGQRVPNTDATAEATTAAIDNLKLLVSGDAGMGFAYDYHVVWMNEGKIPAVAEGQHPARIVMAFYEQPLHVVTKEGTGITSLEGLKGKRVSVGAPNSGTEEQANYVLDALGIGQDITRETLGATESVSALKDGKVDAFFWSGGVPTSSIIDLASTPGLKMVLLPINGATANTIMQANPAVFHPTKFAKGIYPGVESDIDTLAISAVLVAMDSFPADRVTQIVSAIFEGKSEIATVWKGATALTPEYVLGQLGPEAREYLHPGTAQYFKDQGALQ